MDENELTLVRLRRLSRTVMSKNERHRFEARKLCRSNIVKFLENHLTHASDKVRYLALELFCCTIPRLTNKTDCFLRAVLPQVFQCLQRDEAKDTKLKALHFLRGFFRHTKSFSGFIDNFVELGVENSDPGVQISCCTGLSIVFDQDIGNNLFSHLVVSVANLLTRPSSYRMSRAAYRGLRHIHKTVGDERFYFLMNAAYQEARAIYIDVVKVEEMDPFLSTNSYDCSTLLSEYQMKRKYLNFEKDFGILDHSLIDQIQRTKNCERAKALNNLRLALKRSTWAEEDMDQHILDFFKVIRGFTQDSNRLIQMYGLDILKEFIKKMGFVLSPHIYSIVEILQNALMSANSKIRCKVNRVIHKLMNNTHPMTVMWYMLNTKNSSIKEAVLLLIQEKISYFPYFELDMVALCNHIGQYLEDKNLQLAKISRDCMILLLDVMRGCPVYGIRTDAVRVLLRNHKLSRETLKDIGVIGSVGDGDYTDYFESCSGEETTDMDTGSFPTATSVSLISTPRSTSTVGESENRRNDSHRETILAGCDKIDCEEKSNVYSIKTKITKDAPPVKQHKENTEFQLQSQSSFQDQRNWINNFHGGSFTVKNLQNIFTECPSIQRALAPKVESASETTLQYFGDENDDIDASRLEVRSASTKPFQNEETIQDLADNGLICSSTDSEKAINDECRQQKDETVDIAHANEEDVYGKQRKKYFTPFCLRSDSKSYTPKNRIQNTQAGGDCDVSPVFEHMDFQKDSVYDTDRRLIKETCVQEEIKVDILNKDFFNINIMQVQNKNDVDSTNEVDDIGITEYTEEKVDSTSNQIQFNQEKQYFSPDIIRGDRNFMRRKKITICASKFGNINSHMSSKENHQPFEKLMDTNTKTPNSKFLLQQQKDQASVTAEIVNDADINAFAPASEIKDNNCPSIDPSAENPISLLSKDDSHIPSIQYTKEKKIIHQKDKHCNQILYSAEDSCSSVVYSTEERNSPEPDDKYGSQINNSFEVLSSPDQTECPTVFHSPDGSKLQVTIDNYCTPISRFQDEPNIDTPDNINRTRIIYPLEHQKNLPSDIGAQISYSSTVCKIPEVYDQNTPNNNDSQPPETVECNSELSFSSKDFDKISTPFLPKSRQLTRTPVEKKIGHQLEVQQKGKKPSKGSASAKKVKKSANIPGPNQVDETANNMEVMRTPNINGTETKPTGTSKYSSPSKWSACQWRRDLEYASKAAPCLWADKFERAVQSMKPFSSPEEAENEMKKAIDNLYGKSWKDKEEAMPVVIRLAKHHPEAVHGNSTKIIISLCHEIKNFRQSVAGKAILTAGFLYEIMGKTFESDLRPVVGALLFKSGNRTLAAYFRLVIKSLMKIINSTSPQKAAKAFILEGQAHPNKSVKETAAQFIAILTRTMGPEKALYHSSNITACAANFVFDSSALTRYCGMCMFEVLMKHPEFENKKDKQLDVNMIQNLSKILKKIKAKGISEETFPISIID